MCFSAGASFGAGLMLSVIGVASIKKARQKRQIVFAAIPFLFSIQQMAEGFLWLSLSDPTYVDLKQSTTYIFLCFAQVIWPVYVPLAIVLLEKNENRKRILKVLLAIGLVVSLYLAFCLMTFHVESKISGYHISYGLDYPDAISNYCGFLYIVATITPSFFSTIKRMWYLGAAILVSYVITEIFYTDYIVSVWCFFASVISMVVYVIMYEITRPAESPIVSSKLDLPVA